MKNSTSKFRDLSWQQVLHGYSMGIFPMGTDDRDAVSWYEANPRAIIPVELPIAKLNVPRSLMQVIKKNEFEIRINTAFAEVIKECAARESTWINRPIIRVYGELHTLGFAHSVEAWFEGKLAGGLYGVALHGAFFGESMFYKVSNASKVCVVRLYEILKQNKYLLFDIQMMTPHFNSLGAIDISKRAYQEILERAMEVERRFKY